MLYDRAKKIPTGRHKKKVQQKIPRDRISHSKTKTDTKTKRRGHKPNIVRGREVTIRDSAAAAQVIYGRMRAGGVATYVDTSDDTKAYLITGQETDDNQLVWTAQATGAAGNGLTLTLTCTGTNGSFAFTVIGLDVSIRLKSSGGVSTTTMSALITAVQGNATVSSLLRIQKLDSSKNGIVEPLTQTNLSYGGGTWLHQYITLAAHQIDAIENLYIDDRTVVFGAASDPRWGTGVWANKVFLSPVAGTDSQEVQPDLHAQKPTVWTDTDRQQGCGGAYLILVWDQNLFPEGGEPEIEFLVRGKPCYDPRYGRTEWTRNAALIIADFICNQTKFGFKKTYADIDLDILAVAANACDETVVLADASTEARYCIDGVFDTSETKEQVLQEMLAAMQGYIVWGPQIRIYAGVWRAPTITLTDADLRGELSITTHLPQNETFNCIKGTYVNPANKYQEDDIPVIKNSTYITQDGGVEIYEDVAMNFVTQNGQAQRLNKIELEMNRQGIQVNFPAKLSGLLLQAGDTVALTLGKYGYSSKTFRVDETDFVVDSDSVGIDLVLREIASGVYDWADGAETVNDLAPNTSLPSPTTVDAVTGLTLTSGTTQLYIRNDGTVQPRIRVDWTSSTNPYVQSGGYYQVEFKLHAASEWTQTAAVIAPNNFTYITDVKDGQVYDVRVYALNALGFKSAATEVDSHTVIGKTAAPSDVGSLTAMKADFGIVITWPAISDLDADQYEIRVGATNWASSTMISRGRGESFAWAFQTAGTYVLRIKAIDTTGNYSTNDVTTSITISTPSTPASITSALDEANLVLTWTPPTTSDFAIKEYEIRYGASFAAGVTIAKITGKSYRFQVGWLGARTFWIAAIDVAGNVGTAGSHTRTITVPNPITNFAATVVDNSVLLDWDDPLPGDLPVDEYLVYKGDTFASSVLLGTVFGTFHTYVERVAGTYVYWVVPVDTAGNEGAETSATTTVTAPNNFFIRDEQDLTSTMVTSSLYVLLGGSSSASHEDIHSYWLPYAGDDAEIIDSPIVTFNRQIAKIDTFDSWFTTNGWTTLQDAIDAGYDPWLSPTITDPGYIEWQIDYGVVFSSSFIDLSWSEESGGDALILTPSISVSEDGSTWTTYASAAQLFAMNFRYVRYRFDFEGTSANAVSRLYDVHAKISLKIEEETGVASVLSADSGGTVVNFTLDFLDVQDIQATIRGVLFGTVVVNFTDVPDPVSFQLLAFDKDGNRINASVGYRVIGAVNGT